MKIVNVVSYEGLYAVTDSGDVYSLKTGRKLKAIPDKHGYLLIVLNKNGLKYTTYVHKIVYYSFNKNQQLTSVDDLVIDHIDGDKTNNHLDNLRKITTRENTARAKTNPLGRGVHYYPARNKYGAAININKVRYHLGMFLTAEEAHSSYQDALCNFQTYGILPHKIDHSKKLCKGCGVVKPIDDFYYVKNHGRSYLCKECMKAYNRERRRNLAQGQK